MAIWYNCSILIQSFRFNTVSQTKLRHVSSWYWDVSTSFYVYVHCFYDLNVWKWQVSQFKKGTCQKKPKTKKAPSKEETERQGASFWGKQGLNLLRTPPRAHGMRTSHSCVSSSFGSMWSPPLKFVRQPVSSLCLSKSTISSPFWFWTAPVMSLTAMILPPLSWMSLATQDPTLPKPWKVFLFSI